MLASTDSDSGSEQASERRSHARPRSRRCRTARRTFTGLSSSVSLLAVDGAWPVVASEPGPVPPVNSPALLVLVARIPRVPG